MDPCTYACTHVHMHVRMYICMYACTYACTHVHMHVCMLATCTTCIACTTLQCIAVHCSAFTLVCSHECTHSEAILENSFGLGRPLLSQSHPLNMHRASQEQGFGGIVSPQQGPGAERRKLFTFMEVFIQIYVQNSFYNNEK